MRLRPDGRWFDGTRSAGSSLNLLCDFGFVGSDNGNRLGVGTRWLPAESNGQWVFALVHLQWSRWLYLVRLTLVTISMPIGLLLLGQIKSSGLLNELVLVCLLVLRCLLMVVGLLERGRCNRSHGDGYWPVFGVDRWKVVVGDGLGGDWSLFLFFDRCSVRSRRRINRRDWRSERWDRGRGWSDYLLRGDGRLCGYFAVGWEDCFDDGPGQ